jgi:RNA polymerase sigma-70 factor (ECF subfamily)
VTLSATMLDGEAELMRRIADGDERALRTLAQQRLPAMLALAERMLRNRAEADDVAQEALVRIWRNAGRWRPQKAKLSTWIHTIVYRLCLDRLRRRPLATDGGLDGALEVADPAPIADAALADAQESRRLRTALQALQPRQRAAVVLFYYQEMEGPDAAAVLGLNLRAFWSLLHRARQALHLHLKSADDALVPAVPERRSP